MNKIKLLTIDDDPYICEVIRLYAEKEGYEVAVAHDGETGLAIFYDVDPDLVLLDIMLPEYDGWEVCRQIRAAKPTPVIMLTGKGESYDKLKGFQLGADDYVVKPFDPKELMARLKAVLRRSTPSLYAGERIRVQNMELDMGQYLVVAGGEPFTLPPKEMELLYYLAVRPGRVFTRQQLLDQIWGYDFDGEPRTVDVHIKRIREKLRPYEQGWSIATVRGIGYKFEVKE